MANKIKEFVRWISLVSKTNTQSSKVYYLNKKRAKLYDMLVQESTNVDITDNCDIPCFICPSYSKTTKCTISCSYHFLNNKYLQAKQESDSANKTYQSLVAERNKAYSKLFSRNKVTN